MAQGPTNVNLIATYIHNNPGCRRVDIKRMLHRAATGEHTDNQYDLQRKNQYFQRYGSEGNVYLDRLWYNTHDKVSTGKYSRRSNWSYKNNTRKSAYYLTWAGEQKVWTKSMIRPFKEGTLVEWQWNSPNNKMYGWRPCMQGLVVERTDLYGLWLLPVGTAAKNSQLMYVSHQAFIRNIND